MPQYPERYGIKFDTDHGAREYPANEHVHFDITKYSGDLYHLTCLQPSGAPDMETYTVDYIRNEHGFRTPDLIEGTPVEVVVVGDSFTAAETISNPFWNQLNMSTIALGLPGSGTLEQTHIIETFGLPSSPKILVLAYFSGNDLSDNQSYLDLQENGLTFSQRTHQGRSPIEYLVSFHLLLYMRDLLTTTSTYTTCHYPVTAQTTPSTPIAFFDTMVSILSVDEQSLTENEAFTETQSAIINITEQTTEINTKFVLMYIPQKAEVYWNFLGSADKEKISGNLPGNIWIDKNEITSDKIDANLSTQRRWLQNLAEEQGFEFLDLTPYLIEQAQTGNPPYFYADTHWNQQGHDIVGEVLGKYLSQITLDINDES